MSLHHHCDRCGTVASVEATFENNYQWPEDWTTIGSARRAARMLCASCTAALEPFLSDPKLPNAKESA